MVQPHIVSLCIVICFILFLDYTDVCLICKCCYRNALSLVNPYYSYSWLNKTDLSTTEIPCLSNTNVLLFHQCPVVWPMSCFFTNVLFFHQCPVVSPMSCCFTNVLLFHQCPVVSPMSCCLTNVLLFDQCPVVSPLTCCLTNVLQFDQCPVVWPLSCCFTNVLLFDQCPAVSPMSCCFTNVLLFHQCPVVSPMSCWLGGTTQVEYKVELWCLYFPSLLSIYIISFISIPLYFSIYGTDKHPFQ